MPVSPYTEPQIAPNVGIPWPQMVNERIAWLMGQVGDLRQQDDTRTVPAEWLRGTEQRLHGIERRYEAMLRRLVEAEDLLHEVAAIHGMDKDDE